MAVVIRLSRVGKRSHPAYRIAASEKRSKRDGKVIEYLGFYNPLESKDFSLNKERLEYWVSHGAKLSSTVERLVNQRHE